MAYRQNRGFTLVELLIVIVILGIILSIGVPGYRQYVMRANRADATTALLRLMAAQERFYIQNGSYADDAQRQANPPGGLGIPNTERGYYTLNVAPRNGGFANGYTATAVIDPAENQADDDRCTTFQVNESGQRQAFDSGGADQTEFCWR